MNCEIIDPHEPNILFSPLISCHIAKIVTKLWKKKNIYIYIYLVTIMKKFVSCSYLHAINLRTLLTGAGQHLLMNQPPSPTCIGNLQSFTF